MSSSDPPAGRDTSGAASAEPIQDSLRAALAEFEASQTRPYYDADADHVNADRYYPSSTPGGLTMLVTQTHHDRPRYQPAKELYPWIDLQPNRSIRSLYTGHTYDAAELIAADFHIAELRAEGLRSAVTDTDRADVETELDRELPYNCEHVVPQSWFSKTEPMRGDLHHLFACEFRCNSFRGNTPYTEFPDFPELLERVVRTDCGKSERDGFEPAFGKGAAARAVFYFLIRYPDVISVTELPPDRFGVLLGWHEQDPVSEWERHRNAAISARQGNRNPFIDHPQWAAEVISQVRD